MTGRDRRGVALCRLAVGDVRLLAADTNQVRVEGQPGGREEGRLQRPVLACQEGPDLALPIHYQPDGDGLDPAGRKTGSDLAPQQRTQGVADQAVDHPAGLLRVHQVDVDGARLREGFLDRRLGDLREGDPSSPLRGEAGRLGDVPGDRLAFAVEVGGEIDDVGTRRCLLDRGELLLAIRDDLVHGLEVVLHVHAELVLAGVLRQVADVPVRRQNRVARAQIAFDRLRLGGRFDDHQVATHPRESSIRQSPGRSGALRRARNVRVATVNSDGLHRVEACVHPMAARRAALRVSYRHRGPRRRGPSRLAAFLGRPAAARTVSRRSRSSASRDRWKPISRRRPCRSTGP